MTLRATFYFQTFQSNYNLDLRSYGQPLSLFYDTLKIFTKVDAILQLFNTFIIKLMQILCT